MSRTVLVLRHMLQESAGTLETALTSAGLEVRYIDLFQEVPAATPARTSRRARRARRTNERRRGRSLSVPEGRRAVDSAGTRRSPAIAGDLSRGTTAGQDARLASLCESPSRKSAGIRSIGCRRRPTMRCSKQQDTTRVFQWHGDTFDLAARRGPLGSRNVVPKPGVSLGYERLRPAIPSSK